MMSDLSNTLRNMKFMQRTSESRKKSLKKPSTTTQTISILPSNPIIPTPDHPGCWRIIKNEITIPSQIPTVNQNQPSINYRNSVFSIHDRNYTRLSFQNYNKRIESLMIKYGLKQEINNLEDGEIDASDNDENEKKSINEDIETKHVTTLVKTIRKKFNKKPFSRIQFDNNNKTRITKRRRRTHNRTSTN
ncbi:unnamed protein product [Rotaria sp. Silwood2]|nr:unnamed protein product [Rotaria sp. Silwood2]CAF2708868.1 unnamed protein product [Rotaria sp. Silwood2]CAF2973557.1 unnamed protein product [Rotaria sp. Silwood2]CAF3118994.1 unnamed protein product [Rotaria sp. Silwood2]CAF3864482.1 unnamed protein product [Rotaria sp. Silwood2]